MVAHADILDRSDPIRTQFWASVIMHVVVIGGLSLGAIVERTHRPLLGDRNGGGFGSVLVNPVASIPLPNRGGPQNPVANDTKSQVPTPPPPKKQPKAAPQVKTPIPNAIALHNDRTPKKTQPEPAAQPNKFREQQTYNPNQLYTRGGQQLSSPMMGVQGANGVNIGNSSPFGEQFGWYANLIQESIARNWHPASLNLRASGSPFVVVTFTVNKDGSITHVKVTQSSGYSVMDDSAQRAVLDAHLTELPRGFPRSSADVEMRFELGR